MDKLGPYDLDTIVTGDARELAKAIPDESKVAAHRQFMPAGGWYLSPTSTHQITKEQDMLGMIEGPRSKPNRWTLRAGWCWAYDNDAFNTGFLFWRWARGLLAREQFQSTCLFVVAPDIVGDARATLASFDIFEPMLHRRNWPVALATQDGLKPSDVPWKRVDALFIGGTDAHKLGREAGALMAECIRRKKWLHIGRVNSMARLYKFWRADSWDGTTLIKDPSFVRQISQVVKTIRVMKKTRRLL